VVDAGYQSCHEDDGEDEVAECDSMSACSSGEESLPEGSGSSTDSSSDGEDRPASTRNRRIRCYHEQKNKQLERQLRNHRAAEARSRQVNKEGLAYLIYRARGGEADPDSDEDHSQHRRKRRRRRKRRQQKAVVDEAE
jgi:hypothetical protein